MIEVSEIAKKLQGHIGKKWSTKRRVRMFNLMDQLGVAGEDFHHIQCHLNNSKIIWSISVREGTELKVIFYKKKLLKMDEKNRSKSLC